MQKKIENAILYVIECEEKGYTPTSEDGIQGTMNDAANIFGDTYEEYCTIWDFLKIAF